MSSEIDGLFRDSKVRWWLGSQVAAFVGWLGIAVVMAVGGVPFLFRVLLLVVAAFGVSFLVDPRRSWWGSGPTQVMNEPTALRRYRRSMILWLLVFLVIAIADVTLIVATGIVRPAGT